MPVFARSRSRCHSCLAFLVVAAVLFSLLRGPRALAQSELATVFGRVTDPSGAVVPQAEIEIKNVETNVSVVRTTNSEGLYSIPSLHPGHYLISVRKPGFKTVTLTELTLNVQDNVVRNFQLQLGAISESMTVTADAYNVNTTDATVSTVVNRQFAEDIPMNGRSFQTLIQLTPGAVAVASNAYDGGQFSFNGQRASSNYWTVDGASANIGIGSTNIPGNGIGGTLGSFSVLGGTNSLVSVDALQEFRIQTSTYAPEFGRTPGGQISIVTRSGTDQFHGTLFDYFRNDVLDANDWFANNKGLRKPEERQNDFGGTLGGPIVKNRTFFFFSYEGLRLRLPQTQLTSVPDASFTPGGTTNSRQNAIPALQPYFNAFPLPNGHEILDSGGNPTGAAELNASFSNRATLDAYSLRIDHKLGEKWAIFGRYAHSPSELIQRGAGLALSTVSPSHSTTQTATVGTTWIVSRRVNNDLRFNFSRTSTESSSHLDTFGGAVPLSSLPVPSPFTPQNSVFAFFILSLNNGFQLEVGRNAHYDQRQINLVDTLSLQRGSHDLRFGVDFRRLSPQVHLPLYTQAVFFFDVPSAEQGNSGFGSTGSAANVTVLFRNLGVFAQDTWRVSPRLTLTYGLRWDLDVAPTTLNGPSIPSITGYNPNDFSKLAVAKAGTSPFKTTYTNVAPRFGMAYQLYQGPNLGTVVRGGVGIFYDLVSSEAGNMVTNVPPFGALTFLTGTFPYAPDQIVPPLIPPTGVISSLYAFNPNLKLPYTMEWNVALEQSIGNQQALSASYIGSAGRRLLQTSSIFSPPTNLSLNGNFVDNTSVSDYNSLQLRLQRRLSRGLQVLASYTWSQPIDTGSASSPLLSSNQGVPASGRNPNRAPSDFDVRNAFSAGITYEIPYPKLRSVAKEVLQGWSVKSFIVARSAPPVNISDKNFFFLNNNGINADVRPDLVPHTAIYLSSSQYPGGKAFNVNAFMDPPVDPNTGNPLRQGTVPRNFVRGFGATQWDFAVHRDFPIHELLKLQFRAEMFNVLNHPNFGQPSGCFGSNCSAPFGLSTQTLGQSLNNLNTGGGALDPLYQIGGPRSIQLALKLFF